MSVRTHKDTIWVLVPLEKQQPNLQDLWTVVVTVAKGRAVLIQDPGQV